MTDIIEFSQEDQETISLVPPGYRVELVMASYMKRVLTVDDIDVHERLWFLEALNGMINTYLTESMLATIAPMDDVGLSFYAEAAKLGRPGHNGFRTAFKLIEDVFEKFIAANPSLLTAIRMRRLLRSAPS